MAKSSCPVVVGNEFCFDHEVQLQMKEEWWTAYGGFTIKDVHGRDYFEVDIADDIYYDMVKLISPGPTCNCSISGQTFTI